MVDKMGSRQFTEEQGQMLVRFARYIIKEKLQLSLKPHEIRESQHLLQEQVFQEKCGVFVTLHRVGQLRGCIGNLAGGVSIVQGVKANAINAAFSDPRFSPVTTSELDRIDIEVSVLSEPQLLTYDSSDDLLKSLQPNIDGVVIKKGGASATFLPQVWQQLPKPEEFLSHLCLKAGLSVNEWEKGELELSTYQVQYFTENRQ
jgi:AmmeMemoRadiSam system protein A